MLSASDMEGRERRMGGVCKTETTSASVLTVCTGLGNKE